MSSSSSSSSGILGVDRDGDADKRGDFVADRERDNKHAKATRRCSCDGPWGARFAYVVLLVFVVATLGVVVEMKALSDASQQHVDVPLQLLYVTASVGIGVSGQPVGSGGSALLTRNTTCFAAMTFGHSGEGAGAMCLNPATGVLVWDVRIRASATEWALPLTHFSVRGPLATGQTVAAVIFDLDPVGGVRSQGVLAGVAAFNAAQVAAVAAEPSRFYVELHARQPAVGPAPSPLRANFQ